MPGDAIAKALDAIPECKTGQANKRYLEFPITDPTFTGGDPKTDRVVAIVDGTMKPHSNPMYCLSVTHRGQVKNGLVPCT